MLCFWHNSDGSNMASPYAIVAQACLCGSLEPQFHIRCPCFISLCLRPRLCLADAAEAQQGQARNIPGRSAPPSRRWRSTAQLKSVVVSQLARGIAHPVRGANLLILGRTLQTPRSTLSRTLTCGGYSKGVEPTTPSAPRATTVTQAKIARIASRVTASSGDE